MIRLYSLPKVLLLCLTILWWTNLSFGQTCGYAYSKTITIDHNNVSGTSPHSDFPLLISVTDPNLRHVGSGGHVENANGYDILFLSSNGEQIAHQVERYVSTTGQLIAWLRVPKLYVEENTTIQMVYGNSLITVNQTSTATWNNNYQAVWHLHDDFNDGTSFGNNGTNSGTADIAGKIGDGQSFDGVNDRIYRTDATLNGNIPALSTGSPDEFTFSAWIYIDVLGARRPILTKQGDGGGNDRGFSFMMESDNRLKIELFKNNVSGDRTEVYSTATLSASTWYHVALTYNFVTDGTSQVRMYINGVNDGSTDVAVGPIFTNSRDLDIGRYFWTGGTEYYHDGILDEVRISDAQLSAGWIATEYLNQNNPSAFYSIGAEVGGTYNPTIPSCGSGFRKTITINSAQVSGSSNLTDFPVLVSFTDNDLRTVANGGGVQNANGYDIVFTDSNLIPYDFQIDTYSPTTGNYVAWVRIPSLPATTDLQINMLYGNPDVFANPSTRCTWASAHTAVWHLHDDFQDATINEYNGTNNGTTDNTSSKIGDGQSFSGTQFIELPGFPNMTTNFTISGWIQTTSNGVTGQRVFCDDVNNTGGYALSLGDPGAGRLRFYSRSMSTVSLDAPNLINNNTWYYVAGVVDRTNQDRFIYVNGVVAASNLSDGGTWGTDAGNASIGGETNSGESGNRFRGNLDEIRITNSARSADWLLTEYRNQNNPSSFYTVGAEIELNAVSTNNGDWDQTSRWSTGAVPGLGSNVTILDNIDLDDRDVELCNLTISTSNGSNASLDVMSGYRVTVTEDLQIDASGSGNVDATLLLTGANSKVIVEGDMLLSHTNGDDLLIDLDSDADSLIVRGGLFAEHDGGGDVLIALDHVNAVFLVEGDAVFNMNDGAGNTFTLDLNAGNMHVTGNLIGSRSNDFSDLYFDLDGGNLTADSISLSSSGGNNTDEIIIRVDNGSQFTSNSGMYLSMGGGDDHEIYINNDAGTSGTITINGDLLIDKTGGDDLNINVMEDNSLLHITGDFNVNSDGAEQITITVDNDGIVDIDGDLNWTHLAGQAEEITLIGAGSPTFNVDGNFTVNLNGGNDQYILDLDAGQLTVTGNMNVTKNANTDDVNIDLNNGTLSISGTFNATHQGNGTFFIDLNSASVLNAGTFNAFLNGGSAAEELLIDIDDNSQLNVTNNALIQANSGNDLELHIGENSLGSTAQFNVGGNLTLDHAGNTNVDDIQFILSDDAVVTVTGQFIMTTNGSSTANNFFTEINDNARLTVSSDIVMSNSVGSDYLRIEMNDNAHLQIGGDFVRNANPNNYGLVESNSTTTTIEYNGTGAQVFADDDGAGTDGIEYELVVINNSFGTEPQLSMEAPVTISNSITFTDGVLQTTAGNLLTIANNAIANGGSTASYVSGPLQKAGDDDFTFALGKNGNWARLAISDIQNGPSPTDAYTAEYFDSGYSEAFWDSLNYAGDPGGLYNTSIVEHWDLTRDAGVGQPQVTLYWNDNTTSFIDDTSDLVVAHYLGGNVWANEGGVASGILASGSVRSTAHISSFSVFTFGSTLPNVNPLPVELLSFEAIPDNLEVKLRWTTLSEINNDYFTVLRSSDGVQFTNLMDVDGGGNSRKKLVYQVSDDNPLPGISYYQLMQTDFDGQTSLSEIRVVQMGQTGKLIAYPNPVSDGIMHLNKQVTGQLYSADGRFIRSFENTTSLELKGLVIGVYLFHTRDGDVIRVVVGR